MFSFLGLFSALVSVFLGEEGAFSSAAFSASTSLGLFSSGEEEASSFVSFSTSGSSVTTDSLLDNDLISQSFKQSNLDFNSTSISSSLYSSFDSAVALESYAEGCFILRVNNYSKIESVLAALRIEQIRVLEMELMQPDLEDVFVKITGNTKDMESV